MYTSEDNGNTGNSSKSNGVAANDDHSSHDVTVSGHTSNSNNSINNNNQDDSISLHDSDIYITNVKTSKQNGSKSKKFHQLINP